MNEEQRKQLQQACRLLADCGHEITPDEFVEFCFRLVTEIQADFPDKNWGRDELDAEVLRRIGFFEGGDAE